MDYKQLDNDDLSIFQKIIGSQYIFSDTQQLLDVDSAGDNDVKLTRPSLDNALQLQTGG